MTSVFIFKLSQVFDFLNSAELICLTRHILIPENIIAECMVSMNSNSKNANIWLGCGHNDKGQLSCLDLNTEGHTLEVNTSTLATKTLVECSLRHKLKFIPVKNYLRRN